MDFYFISHFFATGGWGGLGAWLLLPLPPPSHPPLTPHFAMGSPKKMPPGLAALLCCLLLPGKCRGGGTRDGNLLCVPGGAPPNPASLCLKTPPQPLPPLSLCAHPPKMKWVKIGVFCCFNQTTASRGCLLRWGERGRPPPFIPQPPPFSPKPPLPRPPQRFLLLVGIALGWGAAMGAQPLPLLLPHPFPHPKKK